MPLPDSNLFRDRFSEACRIRRTTCDKVCRDIGLGSRRRIDLAVSGVKALDIYRLVQIADQLHVSIDWLLGRSDVMELPKAKGA
jgi:hypothetical protein